uniref:DUF6824 domain-containing protein n=1 Tax=Grammatophora oceanica TaxID=210454 RepID=A0A6U5LGP5_9STRA|mmetsp:Transcript_33288/g.49330  ORF Transcript_33288/g.49330 Transcript_33288/m.49330 type:complete len:211 (+) Transcript_33288:1837-2469(+)
MATVTVSTGSDHDDHAILDEAKKKKYVYAGRCRSSYYKKHNRALRSYVAPLASSYNKASRTEKSVILNRILAYCRDNDYVFLGKDGITLLENGSIEVRHKIGHMLRDSFRHIMKKKNLASKHRRQRTSRGTQPLPTTRHQQSIDDDHHYLKESDLVDVTPFIDLTEATLDSPSCYALMREAFQADDDACLDFTLLFDDDDDDNDSINTAL